MAEQHTRQGALVMADGSVFEGDVIGGTVGQPVAGCGEVVFNTVLSGYQEVLTDPSYAGQIVTFTYPHIGNYGVNSVDFESKRPFCRGVIVRDLARRFSNHRADESLVDVLDRHQVAVLTGIDTRRLTRLLRDTGSMVGAFGEGTVDQLAAAAAADPGTDGIDLVATVTTDSVYTVEPTGGGRRTIVAFDFGIKQSIVRDLAGLGRVHVVPASTSAAEVMALVGSAGSSGVFLSNGPGDPSEVTYAVETIAELLGQTPIFGICLGHQLLAQAIGATTFKLPFGHHGGNHPVRHEATGKVEITSQNHNFCVDPDSLVGRAEVTHLNLNDGTIEGMRIPTANAFSVQYHPEAGPGPHDAKYLFGMFADLIDSAAN